MLYKIIFSAKSNFPIRSRYFFLFSLRFKSFCDIRDIFISQINSHVVLAGEKSLKNVIFPKCLVNSLENYSALKNYRFHPGAMYHEGNTLILISSLTGNN